MGSELLENKIDVERKCGDIVNNIDRGSDELPFIWRTYKTIIKMK
jgi:hypothetical protein